MTNIILKGPQKNFEEIKKLNNNGIEYWEARELMPLLEYSQWRNFMNAIDKAMTACKASKQNVQDHFVEASKMMKIATGSKRETLRKVTNFQLSRYACYLIAQNGDPTKEAIAMAQTYFAIQARRQEVFDQLSEDEKRLYVRNEVKDQNKKLFDTAKDAGVNNFAKFNDAGYLGLYGMTNKQIKEKKNLGKDNVLDRAGSTELAANLFRITQTDEKIKKENIRGEYKASKAHNLVGGRVRQTIRELKGTMPEDLKPEKHIKEIEKSHKKELDNFRPKNKVLE